MRKILSSKARSSSVIFTLAFSLSLSLSFQHLGIHTRLQSWHPPRRAVGLLDRKPQRQRWRDGGSGFAVKACHTPQLSFPARRGYWRAFRILRSPGLALFVGDEMRLSQAVITSCKLSGTPSPAVSFLACICTITDKVLNSVRL